MSVWRRLVWKEARESWVFVVLGLLLPPVALYALHMLRSAHVRLDSAMPALGAVMALAILLWAVRRAGTPQPMQTNDSHLPIPPKTEWLVSVLLLTLVAAGLGAWLAAWYRLGGPVRHGWLVSLLGWAIYFAAVHLVTRLVTKSWSSWAAVAVGLIWIWVTLASGTLSSAGDWRHDILIAARVNASFGLAAFLGILYLTMWPHRALTRTSRYAVLALAVILAGGLLAAQHSVLFPETREAEEHDNTIPFDVIYEPGNPFRVELWRLPDKSIKVVFKAFRTDAVLRRVFQRETLAVGLAQDRHVYLAQQRPAEDEVRLVEWDTKRDTVRTAARLKAGRDAFERSSLAWNPISTMLSSVAPRVGFVEPSGSHALVFFDSQAGGGRDLWLVDLGSGDARIVLANSTFANSQAVWPNGHAILSGYYSSVEVDLKTGHVRKIEIPARLGGQL